MFLCLELVVLLIQQVMKYAINRQFAFTGLKYEINQNGRTVYHVKAKKSKQVEEQFDVVIYDPISRFQLGQSVSVESDPKYRQTYRIFLVENKSEEKQLFGYLQYQRYLDESYIYKISIGEKSYQFESRDLRNRRLSIVDSLCSESSTHSHQRVQCPNTLLQMADLFSKTTDTYHVTIDDRQIQMGFLAFVILLDLHECNRS